MAEWGCQYALHHAQQALDGILRNFPAPYLGPLLRITVFPTGRYMHLPNDRLNRQVAGILQTPGQVRDRLTEDVYISDDPDDITAQLEVALTLVIESAELRKRLKKAGLEPEADRSWDQWLRACEDDGDITDAEANLLRRCREAVLKVISVDDFTPAEVAGTKVADDEH